MHRFLIVIAATAVAATVAAAITLPAGASDEPTTKDPKLVACLRDQGLAIPPETTGDAVKQWLLAHDGVDDAVRACKTREEGPNVKVDELVACLRAHGLNPPAAVDQLKPWLAPKFDDAATRDVLKACGLDSGPTDHGPKGDKPAPGDEPGPCAAKPDDAQAQAAKRAVARQ